MPKKKKERDYGRRPEMFSDKRHKDYASMMRSRTDRAQWVKAVEKHSEFKKPYRGSQDYPEMEHFYPTGFDIPFGLPSLIIPRPSTALCAGAVMHARAAQTSIGCGESTKLHMGGHKGGGEPWKTNEVAWYFAFPGLAKGTIDGSTYFAPDCGAMTGNDRIFGVSDTIMGITVCGRSTVIIDVSQPSTDTLTIDGPYDAIVGACYTAQGGVLPYTFDIVGGCGVMDRQNGKGCILSLGSCCGLGQVRVTDGNGHTAMTEVKFPTGIWILTSSCSSPSNPECMGDSGSGNPCRGGTQTIIQGKYKWIIGGYGCCTGRTNSVDCCEVLGAPCGGRVCDPNTYPCTNWCPQCHIATADSAKYVWGCP